MSHTPDYTPLVGDLLAANSELAQRAAAAIIDLAQRYGRAQVAAQQAIPAGWQPIETAPMGEYDTVILGFAPDEEGYSPVSREGMWNATLGRWSSVMDPGWKDSPQPTHWIPLPTAPKP